MHTMAFIMHCCKKIKLFLIQQLSTWCLLCILSLFTTTVLAGSTSLSIRTADLVAVEDTFVLNADVDMKFSEKVFEVFYRLHRIDEYPGTGIGLALVKKAASILGYRVWVESNENSGSTFFLEINNQDLRPN